MQCMQPASIDVMATVQVRNVPDDVLRRLKVEAAQNGRSLNAFMLERMTSWAERPTLAEYAARVQARGPVEGVTMADIVDVIRKDRDSH
jgi:antitoxin FitA